MAVGDPAQCEALRDQQMYDVRTHKRTSEEGDRQAVRLSNRGLSVYSEFSEVIILTKAHRLTKIDNPTTPEELPSMTAPTSSCRFSADFAIWSGLAKIITGSVSESEVS